METRNAKSRALGSALLKSPEFAARDWNQRCLRVYLLFVNSTS